MSWYWPLVAWRLSDAGHEGLSLELPADDRDAGLSLYADLAVAAAEDHDDLVVAAQSMGAFTAVPVCTRLPARRLVLLNAMVPAPGETAGAWWQNTGSREARVAAARAGGDPEAFGGQTYFPHHVSPEIAPQNRAHERGEGRTALAEPGPVTPGA